MGNIPFWYCPIRGPAVRDPPDTTKMAKHRRKTETGRNVLYTSVALIGVAVIAGAVYWITGNLRSGPDPSPGSIAVGSQPDGTPDPDQDAIYRTLLALEDAMSSQPVTVRVAGAEFALNPSDVGFDLDEAALAEQAADSADPEALVLRLQAMTDGEAGWPPELEPAASINERAMNSLLNDYESEVLDVPFEGSIRLEGTTPVAEYPRPGEKIDRDAAIPALTEALLAFPRTGTVVLDVVDRAPLLTVSAVSRAVDEAEALLAGPVTLILRRADAASAEPGATDSETDNGTGAEQPEDPDNPARRITLERDLLVSAFYSRVEREPAPRMAVGFDPALFVVPLETLRGEFEDPPVNASITTDRDDNVVVNPGLPGTLLDPELAAVAAAEAAQRADRTAQMTVLDGAPPEVTTEDILALGIKGKISEFTTRHSCCQPRVTNIHLFADIIDGTIVMPGDTLSLNDAVGERTTERGFKPAPTIIRGKLEDTVGGGVSQFATTFYNAVFYAGLEDIEHHPHSYYFSRYPEGNEATISWRDPDLIFRNDTEAAVLIRTQYTDTSITVKFFGDNGGRQVRRWLSGRYSPTEPPVEYIANPERDPYSEEHVVVEGRGGWSVTVGRVITYADGAEKEERWPVRYRARPREVEVHPCRLPESHEEYTEEECPPEETTTTTAAATTTTTAATTSTTSEPEGEPEGETEQTAPTTTSEPEGETEDTVPVATTEPESESPTDGADGEPAEPGTTTTSATSTTSTTSAGQDDTGDADAGDGEAGAEPEDEAGEGS